MQLQFTEQEEKSISLYFHISILTKGFISLAEIVVGILAFFIPLSTVTNFIVKISQAELAENSVNSSVNNPASFSITDFIASHIITYAEHIPVISAAFIGIYLLSRGLIKVLLIYAMLKNRLWAYPNSLVVLGLFVTYQLYQILTTGSVTIILLTIFDLIVMWFIWEEYKVLKSHEA